jgi:translocator protein
MWPFKKKNNLFVYLTAIVGVNAVGALGSLFTPDSNLWYDVLIKPSFNPPGWIFGPVWITLYTMIGIAFYMLWRQRNSKKKDAALLWFWIQLFLNAIWTPIFFGAQQIGLALVVIILLVASIITTMVKMNKISKTSAYLFVPYLLWVSFATVLNATLLYLN